MVIGNIFAVSNYSALCIKPKQLSLQNCSIAQPNLARSLLCLIQQKEKQGTKDGYWVRNTLLVHVCGDTCWLAVLQAGSREQATKKKL